MKGLILKDFYTLLKQMKMYIAMILILSLIPGYSVYSFAVIYAAMMPVTAFAYDERSKWNVLANMMPYKVSDIVMSKYVLGYSFIGACTLLDVLSQICVSLIKTGGLPDAESIAVILTVMCVAFVILALNLPAVFMFGVEKGRVAMLIMISVGVASAFFFDSVTKTDNTKEMPSVIMLIVLLVSAVINVVSALLSIKIYSKKYTS